MSRHFRGSCAIALSTFLSVSSGGTGVWAAQATAPGTQLHLVIVEGDGAINNIKQRTTREMVVRVEDENHRPVAGAAVAFSLPTRGAGGVFSHGSRLLTVMSDQNGRAVATAMKPNHALGAFRVNVTASFQGQTATASIAQTNVLAGAAGAGAGAAGGAAAGGAAGGLSGGVIAGIVAGAAAVAAGVGVAVAKSQGGGSTAKPTATIGAGGPVVVGPPR